MHIREGVEEPLKKKNSSIITAPRNLQLQPSKRKAFQGSPEEIPKRRGTGQAQGQRFMRQVRDSDEYGEGRSAEASSESLEPLPLKVRKVEVGLTR